MTASISTTPFFRRLAEALDRQAKAVVKLNLLRLTRVICDTHPERATLVSRFDLASIVDKLAKQDEAVLVRELAKEIYPTLLVGGDAQTETEVTSATLGAVPKRVLSAVKRTTSESRFVGMREKTSSSDAKEEREKQMARSIVTPVKGEENKQKRKIPRSQLR